MEVKECYKDPLGPGSNLVSSPTSAPFTADDPMTPSSDPPEVWGWGGGSGVSVFLPLHLPRVPREIPTDQKTGEERVKLRGRWKRIDSSLEAAQMSGPAAAQDCQPKGGSESRESSRADGLARAPGD